MEVSKDCNKDCSAPHWLLLSIVDLQEAGPSGWSFAKGRSLRRSFEGGQMIFWERPAHLDDHFQDIGPSRWSFAFVICHCLLLHVVICCCLSFVVCCYLSFAVCRCCFSLYAVCHSMLLFVFCYCLLFAVCRWLLLVVACCLSLVIVCH